MDHYSYTSLARVKCLLVPAGGIAQTRFEQHVAAIRTANEVRLLDISPTLSSSNLFNPQGFPNGRIFYDFQLSLNDQESLFLHDFEPYRKIFIVVAVSDDNIAARDIERLQKLYKSSIVHTGIVFGAPHCAHPHKGVFYHNKNNIETIVCDISQMFLNNLNDYLQSYQHITLRSPGSMSSTSNDWKIHKNFKLKKHSTNSSITQTLSDVSNGKILTTAERRDLKSRGRQLKILGNLYMLAGKYNNALKELNDAIILLKQSSDYLWLGSALESISVLIIMMTALGLPYQVPKILATIIGPSTSLNPASAPSSSTPSTSVSSPVTTPRNSFAISNIDINKFTLPELIQQITAKILNFYELSTFDNEDFVPQLVYCESILRISKFLCVLNIGGGINDNTLNHLIRNEQLRADSTSTDFKRIDKFEILNILNKILTLQLKSMDILSQTKIYSSLASIYGDLGLLRKRSFIIRTLFVSLIPELTAVSNSTNNLNNKFEIKNLLDSILYIYKIGISPESDINDSYQPKWNQLHISIIKLCIIILTKINDFKNVVIFKSILLTRYHDSLTDIEQTKIFNEINQFENSYVYWDPFLLRNISLIKPVSSPKREFLNSNPVKENEGVIYNPYKKATTLEEIFYIQEEFLEFQITLQNPFGFTLQIKEILIDGFEVFQKHFSIPPKSIKNILVLCKPVKNGEFMINSIKMKIFNSVLTEFKLVKINKPQPLNKLKLNEDSDFKVLETFNSNLQTNNIQNRCELNSIKLNVIPPQPFLQVTNKSNHIMLLEGGRATTKIKIKNNSNVVINHIKFSSLDSTIQPLTAVLNNKGLPTSEVYEIEYFLHKNPLRIKNEVTKMAPFEEIELEIEITGKRGMTQANLVIDYGVAVNEFVYTRQCDIPIRVMVNPSTDLAGCDFIPLISKNVDSSKGDIWKFINSNGDDYNDYVLFIIDLRNCWNKTMNVALNYEKFKTVENIVPMDTKRFIIPIHRVDLDYQALGEIPSFSNKQYVISKISKNEDNFIKQAFWYRDYLLKKISGRWSVGDVEGDVEFRGIRLSQRMLSILKTDKVDIQIKIKEQVKQEGVFKVLSTDVFYTVCVEITNLTGDKLDGVVRNVPIASNYSSIDRRLLFNGVLQKKLSKEIEVGETRTLEIGCVVLERGEYEWGVVFDSLVGESQHISRQPLRLKAR